MHRVFCYGTLKKGERNNHLLARSKFISAAVTDDTFKMYTVGFPVVMRSGQGWPVTGEVYEVDDDTLYNLDMLENEGSMYNRETIDIVTPSGDYLDDVFIYVGNQDYWKRCKAHEYKLLNDYGELAWTP